MQCVTKLQNSQEKEEVTQRINKVMNSKTDINPAINQEETIALRRVITTRGNYLIFFYFCDNPDFFLEDQNTDPRRNTILMRVRKKGRKARVKMIKSLKEEVINQKVPVMIVMKMMQWLLTMQLELTSRKE